MKIITISQIGYNHPRSANWSYGVFKVDTINVSGYEYQMSYTVKENFGGDSRFIQALKKDFAELIANGELKIFVTKGVYTGTGTPSITGMAQIEDMEGKEFYAKIVDFIKNDNK